MVCRPLCRAWSRCLDHSYHVRGLAYGLRPVSLDDAGFIAELRATGERTQYLHAVDASDEAQRAWIQAYLDRADDYYFVIVRERDGQEEGLVGLYDVDAARRSGEWGRWIVRRGSLAGVESALRLYEFAFDRLSLETVRCRTVSENQQVLSFHDACGLPRVRCLPGFARIGSASYEVIEHQASRATWPALRARLEPKAVALARRVGSSS